ncbi:MAG: alpha/beta fold hydrolase [Pseudomonadota bacterium]
MPLLSLGPDDGLFHLHHPPERTGAPTFVFVNALTGNTGSWEGAVAPAVRAQGFGTLSYNFRGQDDSPFAPDTALTPTLIVEDLQRLLAEIAPARPILCGLSIGGLFAAQAVLAGARAEGLVLLNTLREIGPRIAWVNDAMPKLVAAGGVGLFLDALFPLLVNQEQAAKARPGFITDEPYRPLDPEHGHMNLMRHAAATDWDIDYAALTLPTFVITGLEDRVFLERDVVERLYMRLPDARREDWQDTGHLIPAERPERLAASLVRFGDEIEGARGGGA